jgi:hypothetical protein
MLSSGISRRVARLRTDVSVDYIPSIILMTGFGELGTTLAVTSDRSTLQRNGGDTFLRNVGSYKCHTASHPRRRCSSREIYDKLLSSAPVNIGIPQHSNGVGSLVNVSLLPY